MQSLGKWLLTISFSALSVLAANANAEQKSIVIGVSEIPNVLSKNKDQAGPYNKALDQMGVVNPKIELLYLPPARAQRLFDKAEISCLFPGSKTTIPDSSKLIESLPLTQVEAYIFSLTPYAEAADFSHQAIAIHRGFTYGNIRQKIPAKYVELEDEQATLLFLEKGRVAGVIGYLPDVQGALELMDLPKDRYFYGDAIYSAAEAMVCHDTPENQAFIEQVNILFLQLRQK
jgi:ABC-type amino acid transport substrate-binding protein